MSFETTPEKPKFTVSETHELIKQRWENLRRFFVLFEKVDNKVIFTNNDVLFPLKMEEGKSSPLGIFAEKALSDELKKVEQLSPEEKKKIVEVWPEHNRSALLGRAIFGDKQGRIYRDIDVKGIGLVGGGVGRFEANVFLDIGATLGAGRRGLLDENLAFSDMVMSEEFCEAGIRTSRVLGIIKLNELIKNEEEISIEEARKKGIIDEEFSPVISVRGFGTKARIEDLPKGEEKEELLLKDAQRLVERELGEKFSSTEEYLEWFAKTLGKNVGLCHKNRWHHGYLTPHNITLDCRIVDLDSVVESDYPVDLRHDFERARYSLINMLERLFPLLGREVIEIAKFSKLFQESYLQAGGSKIATR